MIQNQRLELRGRIYEWQYDASIRSPDRRWKWVIELAGGGVYPVKDPSDIAELNDLFASTCILQMLPDLSHDERITMGKILRAMKVNLEKCKYIICRDCRAITADFYPPRCCNCHEEFLRNWRERTSWMGGGMSK